jgi:Txe/YoeB family toxin of Txe-Axe toxin-antitoxin module
MSKDIAEKIVTKSLDNAILDMAKVKKPRTKKIVAKFETVSVPDNLFEVAEVQLVSQPEVISHETIIEVKPVEVLTHSDIVSEKVVKAVKAKKVKSASKVSRKHSKINGFFGEKVKNVSRETLKGGAKVEKLTKSPYWSRKSSRRSAGTTSKLMGRMFNVYNIYKKNAMTGALVIMMLGFVTATTYVTYAYVTSGDADLIGNVAKHVILPVSEQPKVYIIQSEKADLFSNPLFAGIKVGDNVLTYTNAGKVVIYRSSEDKVVNIVNLK